MATKRSRICSDCGFKLVRWKKACEPCRFWSHVDTSEKCWLWSGVRNQDGYGRISIFGKVRSAHRVSWMLNAGEVAEPLLQVLHRCDTPACVRPAHLFLGTRSDNMKDAFCKGRKSNCGAKNPNAKLLASDIPQIRKLAAWGFTRYMLAQIYDINWSAVDRVVRNVSWTEVG